MHKVSIAFRIRRQTNSQQKKKKNYSQTFSAPYCFLSVKIAARFDRKHLVDHEMSSKTRKTRKVNALFAIFD